MAGALGSHNRQREEAEVGCSLRVAEEAVAAVTNKGNGLVVLVREEVVMSSCYGQAAAAEEAMGKCTE